jgi:hypothetical protein
MEFVPAPALAFAGNGERATLESGLARERGADGEFEGVSHDGTTCWNSEPKG